MSTDLPPIIGPVLFLDRIADRRLKLSALFIATGDATPKAIETGAGVAAPAVFARFGGAVMWRARFDLPADRPSSYLWSDESFDVAGDLGGDLRIAYVSCNGEEVGDLDRPGAERNAMWARLIEDHRRAPFALLLHGGDQVYADEVTEGHELSDSWPESWPRQADDAALADLRAHLRRGFVERYAALYRSPEFAWIAARVPSLMQWDDHDICDGWGSLSPEAARSPVGRTLFAAAREAFLTFQHAAAEGDLPPRFADPAGAHLGWRVEAPGLRILAPDLRSERTRRNIMGPGGWEMMETEARRRLDGQTLILSTVPLLGPRLSLLERLVPVVPKARRYEDDLRDQWQSRAHREEWRRILRLVRDMALRDGHDVTALSGEIHLATRAEMDLGDGRTLHQLVASGIAHRAPPAAWARVLGALAWLGEDPLPENPISVRPLPGQRSRYVAERNYLILDRISGDWSARWSLEKSGETGRLALQMRPARGPNRACGGETG